MLTSAGLILPTGDEIHQRMKDAIDAELVAVGAPACDWGTDLAMPLVVGVFALELNALYELTQAVHDAGDPDTAEGIAQDSISALVGVRRLQATPSTCVVKCYGTPGLVIPAGKEVEGGGTDGSARWYLREAATINADGYVDALFECTVVGPTVAAFAAIQTIATPVSGWDSVRNVEAASLGRNRERDWELKLRRARMLQLGASRSLEALRSRLLALVDPETGTGFLTSVAVIENRTASTATVEGLEMPPHSAAAVVYPPTLTTAQKGLIGQVLFDLGPEGIQMYGVDETVSLTKSDGFAMDVGFSYATDLPLTVQITATLRPGYAWTTVKAAIEAERDDYIASLGAGEPALTLELLGRLAGVPGLKRAVTGFNGAFQDIQPLITEVLVFEPSGSTVVQSA